MECDGGPCTPLLRETFTHLLNPSGDGSRDDDRSGCENDERVQETPPRTSPTDRLRRELEDERSRATALENALALAAEARQITDARVVVAENSQNAAEARARDAEKRFREVHAEAIADRAQLEEELARVTRERDELRVALDQQCEARPSGWSATSAVTLPHEPERAMRECAELREQMQFLRMRLRATEEIARLQEEGIRGVEEGRNGGGSTVLEILAAFRRRLIELIEASMEHTNVVTRVRTQAEEEVSTMREKEIHWEVLRLAERRLQAQLAMEKSSVRVLQRRCEEQEARGTLMERHLGEERNQLASMWEMVRKIDEEAWKMDGTVQTACKQLDVLAARVEFASGRLEVVQQLVGNRFRVTTRGDGPVTEMSTSPLLKHVQEEVRRVSAERDTLARRLVALETEEKVKRDQAVQEEGAKWESIITTQNEEHAQVVDELGATKRALAEAEAGINRLEHQVEEQTRLSQKANEIATTAQEKLTVWKADMEASTREAAGVAAERERELLAELSSVKRENAKMDIVIRQLERDIARARERNDAEERAKYEYFEERRVEQDESIKELRRERNKLLMVVRQMQQQALQKEHARDVRTVNGPQRGTVSTPPTDNRREEQPAEACTPDGPRAPNPLTPPGDQRTRAKLESLAALTLQLEEDLTSEA